MNVITAPFEFSALETEVRRLAALHPDAVYMGPDASTKSCRYNSGSAFPGGCGCIFGEAMRNLGISSEILEEFDHLSTMAIHRVLEILGTRRTSRDESWAGRVQGHQDYGYTWSEAVAYADRETSHL